MDTPAPGGDTPRATTPTPLHTRVHVIVETPRGDLVVALPTGWEIDPGDGGEYVSLTHPGARADETRVQARVLTPELLGPDGEFESVVLNLSAERSLPRLLRALVAAAGLERALEDIAIAEKVIAVAEAGGRVSPGRRAHTEAALVEAQRRAASYRVERAMLMDADGGIRPSAEDFTSTYSAGLLTPRYDPGIHLRSARITPTSPEMSPTEAPSAEDSLRAHERAAARESGGEGAAEHEESGRYRSKMVFAGMTTAAALVLTGCGTSYENGERRCTDGDGNIVDDDNCARGGGGGVYFYQYGGSTYIRGGHTVIIGGSRSSGGVRGGFGGIGHGGGG